MVSVPEEPDEDEELGLDYWEARHEHPICRFHEKTGDWRAYRLSDFVETRRFRSSRIDAEWSRPQHIESLITVGLDSPLSHTKVFLLARSGGRDFDPSDSLVLDVVRPYLALRYEAACRVAESPVTCDAVTPRERQITSRPSRKARRTGTSPTSSASRTAPCAGTSRTPTRSSACTRARRPSAPPRRSARSWAPRSARALLCDAPAAVSTCQRSDNPLTQIFGIPTLKEGAPRRSWPRPSASTSYDELLYGRPRGRGAHRHPERGGRADDPVRGCVHEGRAAARRLRDVHAARCAGHLPQGCGPLRRRGGYPSRGRGGARRAWRPVRGHGLSAARAVGPVSGRAILL